MENEIYKKYSFLDCSNVSRETFYQFDEFVSMIINKSTEINIVSRKNLTKELIIERHLIDSAQIIDFIDLNSNTTSDLGTGGGFPGIVIAIMLKNLKNDMKFNLYEKSYHKSRFLKDVSKKLGLYTDVIQTDIFESKNLSSGTIIARAFKPLPTVLDLVCRNFKSYKNLILFMGKNGQKILKESLKIWDFDYTEKKSLTSRDSFILNITNIKKKKLS